MTTVVKFPRRIEPLPGGWQNDEFQQIVAACSGSVSVGEATHAIANAALVDGFLSATIDGETTRWRVFIDGERISVHDGDRRHAFAHAPAFAHESASVESGDRIVAPMPGRIVLVKAKAGDDVAAGDEVLVMEAMKMELTLKAPRAGRIESVQAAAGDFVEADAVLVRLAEGAAA